MIIITTRLELQEFPSRGSPQTNATPAPPSTMDNSDSSTRSPALGPPRACISIMVRGVTKQDQANGASAPDTLSSMRQLRQLRQTVGRTAAAMLGGRTTREPGKLRTPLANEWQQHC